VKYSTGDMTLLGSVCSITFLHASPAFGNKEDHFNCLLFLLSNISAALVTKFTTTHSPCIQLILKTLINWHLLDKIPRTFSATQIYYPSISFLILVVTTLQEVPYHNSLRIYYLPYVNHTGSPQEPPRTYEEVAYCM
jgi:hypothetical protein